ncbi:MAG: cyclase family protein [Bacillota bacterium]|nr:cyclase family protein [Bacillota bacterium]
MTWIDISVRLAPGIKTWPGDTPLELSLKSRADEEGYNISDINMCLHTGTHIDAPCHIFGDGVKADEIGFELLMGKCFLLDASGLPTAVSRRHIQGKIPEGAERLIIKTMADEEYSDDPADMKRCLEADAVQYALEKGARLIGCDAYSIGGQGENCRRVHHAALDGGCVLLERLKLIGVGSGWYEMICLPLKVHADGAPARVIIRKAANAF